MVPIYKSDGSRSESSLFIRRREACFANKEKKNFITILETNYLFHLCNNLQCMLQSLMVCQNLQSSYSADIRKHPNLRTNQNSTFKILLLRRNLLVLGMTKFAKIKPLAKGTDFVRLYRHINENFLGNERAMSTPVKCPPNKYPSRLIPPPK